MNMEVHIAHCCQHHGCKYCNEECPITLGVEDALFECEYCHDERQDEQKFLENISRMNALELDLEISRAEKRVAALLKELDNRQVIS